VTDTRDDDSGLSFPAFPSYEDVTPVFLPGDPVTLDPVYGGDLGYGTVIESFATFNTPVRVLWHRMPDLLANSEHSRIGSYDPLSLRKVFE
jgi:hypothetical protein